MRRKRTLTVKGPLRWPARFHSLRSEAAFTLIEVTSVVVILGILITTGMIAWWTTSRQTDLQGSVEMVKQDLRKAYALTASRKGQEVNGVEVGKYSYRIVFNDDSGNPANAYQIQEGIYGTGNWVPYPERDVEANRIVTGAGGDSWIKPGTSDAIQINPSSSTITFVSRGTIIQTDVGSGIGTGQLTVTMSAGSGNSYTITVSRFGDVSD